MTDNPTTSPQCALGNRPEWAGQSQRLHQSCQVTDGRVLQAWNGHEYTCDCKCHDQTGVPAPTLPEPGQTPEAEEACPAPIGTWETQPPQKLLLTLGITADTVDLIDDFLIAINNFIEAHTEVTFYTAIVQEGPKPYVELDSIRWLKQQSQTTKGLT